VRLKHKIRNLSIGTFINGAYRVFGVLKKGILYGIVIKTNYPNVIKKFSFVKLPEFYSKEDSFPQFKKKLNIFSKIILSFKYKLYASNTLTFVEEICDLPSCALRYGNFLDFQKRNVLFEKTDLKRNKISHFLKLKKEQEFELIKIVAGKYGKHNIVAVYLNFVPLIHLPRERLFDKDIYCNVKLYSYHNEEIFVVFREYHILSRVYDIFIKAFLRENNIEDEIKEFIEKTNY
jgi:hypothetical protein